MLTGCHSPTGLVPHLPPLKLLLLHTNKQRSPDPFLHTLSPARMLLPSLLLLRQTPVPTHALTTLRIQPSSVLQKATPSVPAWAMSVLLGMLVTQCHHILMMMAHPTLHFPLVCAIFVEITHTQLVLVSVGGWHRAGTCVCRTETHFVTLTANWQLTDSGRGGGMNSRC